MKAIVIGLGLIGSDYGEQSHAGVYTASDRIELVGGVDPDRIRRQRFMDRWHVPTYENLVDAVEIERPNVASICTPSNVRFDQTVILCDAGIDAIWCEKPLAEKVSTAESMIRWCKEAGVALQVNFQRRFDPLHQRAKEYDLGAPVHFRCMFTGDMLRVGCHAIDLARFFNVRTMYLDQIEDKGTTIFDVTLTGPKGRIVLAAMGQQMFYGPSVESHVFPGVIEQQLKYVDDSGLRYAMRNGLDSLLDHIEDGTPLLCTGEDGLAVLMHPEMKRFVPEERAAGAMGVPE